MKKKLFDYLAILLITVGLFATIYIGFRVDDNKYGNLYIVCNIKDNEEIIEPNYSYIDNTYYFFLPSNFNVSKSKLVVRNNVTIDTYEKKINSTTSIEEIELDNKFEVYGMGDYESFIVLMKSSNLPSMFISTDTKSIDYLQKDKKYEDTGKLLLVDENGNVNYLGKIDSFSGRGNHSWTLAKRPWSIKLNNPSALLNMSNSKEWVLLANCLDDTDGLRNYFAYSMAKNVGLYGTSCLKFIDLYINHDYKGTYQLCEKIENNSERFDIGDLDSLNNEANKVLLDLDKIPLTTITQGDKVYKQFSKIQSPSNVTGGYIIERNYGDKLIGKRNLFMTDGAEDFVIRYPSIVSEEEIDYIQGLMQRVENAINSKNYIDQDTGKELDELIDLDSWVKKYLIDEITKSEGAGATSSYYYKKQNDDLIYGGPIWDYDKSLGNKESYRNPEGLDYSFNDDVSTIWYYNLYQYPKAFELIKKHYSAEFRPYMVNALNNFIDEWEKLISDSYNMNWHRWKDYLNYYNDYDDKNSFEYYKHTAKFEDDNLKKWINQRTEYLDSVWIIEEEK